MQRKITVNFKKKGNKITCNSLIQGQGVASEVLYCGTTK